MFKRTGAKPADNSSQGDKQPAAADEKISTEVLKQLLADNQDIVFNEVTIDGARKVTVVLIDGMVSSLLVDQAVIKPLIQEDALKEAKTEQALIQLMLLGVVYHDQRKKRDKLSDCLADLLGGAAVLVFDQSATAVTFDIKGFEKRSITEPTNENVLKGSKEAFIEVLGVNTALVRRRIQTSTLKIHQMTIGEKSRTKVSVVYLSDVTNESIVNEVKKKLGQIKIDAVMSAGQIESFLMNNKKTMFPQVLYTERVDKFCANIMEGRVGVLIDGMPVAYITPVDINSFLQAPEDYALNHIQSSLFRILRHICAFSALILPAFYVSITTFHHEMIPTKLAISIIASKRGVPFPTYLEVLLMLLSFEVLLEAGLRLPKAVGQTGSIVGALVVGQAAISASMLSPGVVIVISAAGITGFVVPSQDLSNAIRISRMLLVVLSIIGGLFAVTIGLILVLYHLCGMEVFGVPYMSPYVASEGKGLLKDTLLRVPWYNMKKRPASIGTKDDTRQGGPP